MNTHILGKEDQPGPVFPRIRQSDILFRALGFEKPVGYLDEEPGPVPRERVAPASATVLQLVEYLQPLENDFVGPFAF